MPPITTAACQRQTLAAGELALVERCSCGAVHVTIGAVTLRLSAAAIPAIAETMIEAARVLVLADAFARLDAAHPELS